MVTRDKYSKAEDVKYSADDVINSNDVFDFSTWNKRSNSAPDERIQDNIIVPKIFADLEREASSSGSNPTIVQKSSIPEKEDAKKNAPVPSPAIQSGDFKPTQSQAATIEKAKSISFNSREVRLVGPDQKEVEMKDDVASKVVVALENIQKDATELWDQVNEKLDKGWTEFKSMVEKAIAPASKKSGSATGR